MSFILSWQKNFLNMDLIEAIMKLIRIYATFPTANAEIERGFSSMKRIKTGFRNKLSGRLQGLLMIFLTGEDIKL